MLNQAREVREDIVATHSRMEGKRIASDLVRRIPSVFPEHTNEEVLTHLSNMPDVTGLPVIEHGRPIGLINRSIFLNEMAKPFRREIYSRKSCIAFMDKQPLIVDECMDIQELSFRVVDAGNKALKDGFIITDPSGEYVGMGTGEDLMQAISHLQAEKNRMVMESINYASVIQKSFLRSARRDMESSLKDYFIHWEPRDQVGGDYYFCKKFDDGFFIALIDCTGHGVPGAFMTLIMAAFLDHLLQNENRKDPAGALSAINRKVKLALGQIEEENISHLADSEHSDDGMDTAFCWVDQDSGKVIYAGAKMPLFILTPDDTEVTVYEGDRKGVGYVDTPSHFAWTNREIDLPSGAQIYLTTDGIIDQIGGERSIAFGKRRFSKLILEHRNLPMTEQRQRITEAFYAYQGGQKRRDDVSLLGFRI